MRKLTAATLALGLVGASVLMGSTPSFAADGPIIPPTPPPVILDPPDFTASPSKLRSKMINVLGSVLGAAMPNSWRAEQIANQYQYNYGWDELAARTGIRSDAPAGQLITTDWATKPQTKADYDLLRMEQGLKGGKNGTPYVAPATKQSGLSKKLDGANKAVSIIGSATIGWSVGSGVGKTFSEFLGFDATGGLCYPTFDDGGLVAALTGTDCNVLAIPDEYAINENIAAGLYTNVCTKNGVCMRYIGLFRAFDPSSTNNSKYACWNRSDQPPTAKLGYPEALYASTDGGTTWQFAGQSQASSGLTYFWGSGCNPAGGNAGSAQGLSYLVPGNVFRFGEGTAAGPKSPPLAVQEADPQRTISCSITGSNGATYTSASDAYTEGSRQMGAPECPDLPDGVVPSNIKLTEQGPDGTKVLQDLPTTPEFQQWATQYPECASGACKLDLRRKAVGTVAVASCFDLDEACAGWFTQSNKADLYECRYGTHPVSLAECNVYEGVFMPERSIGGAPYSDPLTGQWSGGQSAPNAEKGFFSAPVRDPEGSRQCQAGWQAPNPVEWVMQPVSCALEKAFVPRATVLGVQAAGVMNSWQATAPGAAVTAVTGWDFNVSVAGCNGLGVRLPFLDVVGLGNFRLGDACSGPLATAAPIARTVLNIVVALGACGGIARSIAGVVNYGGIT